MSEPEPSYELTAAQANACAAHAVGTVCNDTRTGLQSADTQHEAEEAHETRRLGRSWRTVPNAPPDEGRGH